MKQRFARLSVQSFQKSFESPSRKLGVAHRILDGLVSQVELDRPRIVALVGKLKAGTVP